MKIKQWLFLILLFLIFLESFLRFYRIESIDYFRTMKLLHQYHPEYIFGLRPNQHFYVKHFTGKWEGTFTINSLGMRNIEEPKDNFKKVICLGDSLVMGFGVSDEHTFCNLLNEDYKKSGYQFLNAGIDGLGSWGSFERIKEIHNKIKDIDTVLFFVSPNDFTMPEVQLKQGFLPDDVIEEKRLKDPKKNFIDRFQFILTDWFYSLYIFKLTIKQIKLKSYLFFNELQENMNYLQNHSIDKMIKDSFLLPEKKKTCIQNVEKNTIYKTIRKEYIQTKEVKKEIHCPEPIPEHILKECTNFPETIPPLPEFTQNIYKNMIQYTQQNQIKFIVIILPMQIEEIYCNSINKYHPLRIYALQAKLFFNNNNIQVIDLMDETKTLCKENHYSIKDYFIPEDGHLTVIGNKWVANSLSKILEEKLK